MRRIEKNPPPPPFLSPTNTFLYPRAIILPDMKWGLPAQGPQLQTLSSLQNAFTLDCQSAIFSFFTAGKTAEREVSDVKVSCSAFHLVLPREKHGYNGKKNKNPLLPPTPKDTRAGCSRVWTTRADLLMKLKRKRARAEFRAVWGGNWMWKKGR